MTRRRTAAAALAATASLLAGCASSPTARWAQARETLTAAQDATVDLWDRDLLEPEALVVADPAVRAARAALEAARVRLPDKPNLDTYLDAAEAALEAALAAQAARRTDR